MKKVLSLLLVCVFVLGIVTIFSGVASALMIVGDPYTADSWHQKFRAVNVGHFNNIEMIMESGGDFKRPDYFSSSSWNTTYFSSKHLMFGGSSIVELAFEAVFEGLLSEPLSFLFISRYENTIKEKVRLIWNGYAWKCDQTSVPDADIMWLLGPAFIALGILGRKKSKEYL
jgi:hypothetical protein